MNPDPYALIIAQERNEHERRAKARQRAVLHAKAVARRKKAKRGGPR